MTPLIKTAIFSIDSGMARKRITRLEGDIREHPRYSIEEAAIYLHIPPSTLRSWTRGQNYTTKSGRRVRSAPLITLANQRHKLLSFNNLAEAHVLRCTRERDVPLKNVRWALDYVLKTVKNIDHKHPLLSREFSTYGQDVFISQLGKPVNATRQGQLAMKTLIRKYLRRIKRDMNGVVEIYPIKTQHLAINPLLSSGKPIVKGTGISAAILRDRLNSGESDSDVARDYGLTTREVKQAVHELAAA